ncbi:hypothetical protein Cgig2_027377 [Carnegiea gigantea]|uniref:Response regulatory domain-containing protein n=1 Tax=Carnegiea gigantea TaxID=171969 RepID=A0A9Q1KCM0_9CARY|nr:hypothetical protein Cgig2_027377 [Carnegiea gigantea]
MLVDTAQVAEMVDRELKVLIIDNDRVCLMTLEKMLQSCNFIVTKCRKAKEALSILLQDPNGFDIIISDLYMPDMDGFDLLKRITEMDLPVIVTSSNDNENLMRKVILDGACDYLIKPVRLEHIKHVWKYVYQAQRHGINKRSTMERSGGNSDEECSPDTNDRIINKCNNNNNPVGADASRSSDEERSKCMMKKKREYNQDSNNNSKEGDAQVNDDASTTTTTTNARKKQRAVPKKILEIMNVPGLTRENVASHLQKYRQYHKKLEQSIHQGGKPVNLMPSQEQRCFQGISPPSVPDEIITTTSFPSVQASDMAQHPHIVEDMKQAMKLHASSNDDDAFGNKSGDIEMPMALGEVGTDVNMIKYNDYVASYAYSTVDSRFQLVETPCSNWVCGYAYDENGVQNEMEITSMAVGQPYENADMSHARMGAYGYGNIVDLGYHDPYATLYAEPFVHNDDYIIGRLQQRVH